MRKPGKRLLLQGILALLVFISFQSAAQTTYYSRNGGGTWTNNGTWSTDATNQHNGASCGCIPNTTGIVIIADNDEVILPSNGTTTIQSLSVGVGSTGTLTIGNTTNTARTLNITSNFIIGTNGTVQVGGNDNGTHAINIGGTGTTSFTNNGSFNMLGADGDVANVTFTNTGAKTINGSSAITTFNDLTINGPVTFGDNSNPRTLVISDDLTIASTLQSGASGAVAHALEITGDLTSNGTLNLTANGATNQSLTFTDNGSITGTATTASAANMNITGGTRTFGNNNNARTITLTNNFTISASATFQSGNTAAVNHTISLGGNLVNNGALNLTANTPTAQRLTLTGGASANISGSGTFSLTSMTLDKTAGVNVTVDASSNISISTNFTFNSDGLLIVGSNSNIVLSAAATVTSAGAARYFQLDGSSGNNSNLIRTTTASYTPWTFVFPIGTSDGGYTPVSTQVVNPTPLPDANSTLSVKPIVSGDLTGRLRRTFRLIVTGNDNGTVFSNTIFNYQNSDVSAGNNEVTDYTTAWRLESGVWTTVASTINTTTNTFTITGGSAATATLNAGTYYYTIGSSLSVQRSWYSYQTGVYSDFNTWTLDPSGTTFDNPLNIYPAFSDNIRVLNGFTVTADLSNQTLASTTIDGGGILDMVGTTNQNLGVVTGTGILKVQGTALPVGTYTDFVSTVGGTIEYYDFGGTLSTAQTTYNKLRMTNSTGLNITYVLASDMTVNGTFDLVTTGMGTVTWQINNGTGNRRTITLNDDLTIASGGRISVSTSGATGPHLLSMYGNFVNNGSVKFFDTDDGDLDDEADYTGASVYTRPMKTNAVNVTFAATTDQLLTCNNTTDFYRLIVNKGTGQQSILTVNSSSANNFRLWGPANLFSTSSVSNCALSIVNGTLELTGSINIPTLIVDGSAGPPNDVFGIPQNGALWLNGPNVSVTLTDDDDGNDDQRLTVDGLFRVTSGTFNSGFSRGIGSTNGGTIFIEGGRVDIWQYRPVSGGSGIFSYIQTGGVVNVGTTGYNGTPELTGVDDDSGGVTDQFARFSLANSTSSFQMSGGEIHIGSPTTPAGGNNAEAGGLDIQCAPGNTNVTGGNIYMYIPQGAVESPEDAGSQDFSIYSTAPLYNVHIYRVGTTNGTYTAELNSSLTILNNLTLHTGNSPALECNNNNLTIGGSLDIQTGTELDPGTNTITFNGTGTQNWTNNGTITGLNSVVVNKTGTLMLGGSANFPNTGTITSLTLTSGTLNDGGKNLTVLALSNSAVHTGTGSIIYNNAGASTIGGSNGVFGNLTIQTDNTIATSGNQTVNGVLRLVNNNTTLNIASFALTAMDSIYSNAAPGTATVFSNTKRILTSGLHNAGGLTRQGSANKNLLFPVGVSVAVLGNLYTPKSIFVTASTHGTITVRPVSSEHPNVTTTGQSLRFYWRVTSAGYSGITAVSHRLSQFTSTTFLTGTLTNYRSARFDANTLSWATNNVTYSAGGTTTIPSFSTGTNWSGITGDQLDGEYTCGDVVAFGNVQPYYSKASGAWNLATTWTNSPTHVGANAAVVPPCATCPVIIGDGAAINHTVDIDQNGRSCGTLSINTGSTLNCAAFTGLSFGTSTGGAVSGRGTIRVSAAAFPTGDFTNFLGVSGGTVEWYGGAKTLPSSYTGPNSAVLSLASYYNLVIAPNPSADINMPATSLTIYNDFTINGGNAAADIITNTAQARTITVGGALNITGGTFALSNNTAGTSTAITVAGNTTIAAAAAMSVQTTGGTAGTHTFHTTGSITNNGGLDLFGGATTRVCNITFTGTNDVVFGGGNALGADLSLVTVNKGTSQVPTVEFNMGGTVTAINNDPNPWLTITNGTFNFNNAGTYNLIDVDAGATDFPIPTTGKLKVNAGTVHVITDNQDGADMLLSGTLEVSGTGTINVGSAANDNHNDIEYASAGNPTINVFDNGTLYVNGAIRRSTSTINGALVYNQTGGTVTVGGRNCDQTNTRGVFEIDANTGSSFTLTGTSALNVLRQTGGSGYADLFINPINSNVSSTSTISVGLTSGAQGNFRINVAPSIGNFTIVGTSAQTVNMFSNPLIVGGNLTITTPSTLNTNSLDVFIAGNMNVTGTATYSAGTNTTTFNGTGAQGATLTTNTDFYNVTVSKTAGTTLTLSGTSPTSPALNNLNLLTGILDVGNINLTVNRNITINSSQVNSSGGSIVIYSTTGISNTITSSGGSFTNLTLGGPVASSTAVTVSGNLTINGTLTFNTNRYLMIGSHNLTFGSSAPAVVGAGTNAFIRTNGVASDLGVTRNWPAGTSSFRYEVGTASNHTAVFYRLNVTNAGTLTVIPVNSAHLTYYQGSTEQILNYYWTVSRGATLNATATGANPSHTFEYNSSLLTGTGGALVAGYLDVANPVGWITSGHGGTASTAMMQFNTTPTTNIPPAGSSYDYSVGTVNTLPNPIVPLYSRIGVAAVADLSTGGNWTTASNWTTDPDGDLDLNNPSAVVPNGVPVVILNNARINTASNGRRAFRTTINGVLNNGVRTGHNLGFIEGTGIFRSATNTFPAGDYTSFVSSAGGTIEYVAPMTMNSRSTYNNLSIYAPIAGTVTMTNTDLIINGTVTIPAGTTLDNSANNRDINIAGNWIDNGTFIPGTGTVTFNGTGAQTTTGEATFNGLGVNKTGGTLTLGTTTTVNGVLVLTAGNIISNTFPATPLLVLTSSATLSGGSASSFVSGQVRKTMNNATTFMFPTGSNSASRFRPVTISGTSATDVWDVSYIPNDPTADGFPNTSFNSANMAEVSEHEYWQVANGTGTTSAGMTLSFGPGSYASGGDAGTLSSLKTVRWDGTQWDTPPGGGMFGQTGSSTAGTVSVSVQTAFSPQTLATDDINSALPIELKYFKAEIVGASVVTSWATESELNNDYFTVERSGGGEVFTGIGKINGRGTTNEDHTYNLIDTNPLYGWSYYRLKQTDFDGTVSYSKVVPVNYEGPVTAVIDIYPNPSKGDIVTIELKGFKEVTSMPVVIYDQLGHELMKFIMEVDENQGTAKKELYFEKELPKGMYLVKAGPSGYIVKKFIVGQN